MTLMSALSVRVLFGLFVLLCADLRQPGLSGCGCRVPRQRGCVRDLPTPVVSSTPACGCAGREPQESL